MKSFYASRYDEGTSLSVNKSFGSSFLGTRVVLTFLSTFFFLISGSSTTMAKDKNECAWDYEIVSAGTSVGYYIVKVSAHVSNKNDISEVSVKKCALHGVLFKGFTGDNPQRPMIGELQGAQYQYINNLLANDYGKYTETIGIPLQVVKQGKTYKVTTVVQVAKDLLRKNLEEAGIIRKLGL